MSEEEKILVEKIAFLRYEHAKSADAMQKFSIQKQIEEDEKRLAQIRNQEHTTQDISLSSVQDFKNELRKEIEASEITTFFDKMDSCNYQYDKGQFNRLKKEFIFGKYDFDFYERLKLFVNTLK